MIQVTEALFKKKIYLDVDRFSKVIDSLDSTIKVDNFIFTKYIEKSPERITISYLNDKVSKIDEKSFIAIVALLDIDTSSEKYLTSDDLLVRELINKGSGKYKKTSTSLSKGVKSVDFADPASIVDLFIEALDKFISDNKIKSDVETPEELVNAETFTKEEINEIFNSLPRQLSIRSSRYVRVHETGSKIKIGYETLSINLPENIDDIMRHTGYYNVGLSATITLTTVKDRVLLGQELELNYFVVTDQRKRKYFSTVDTYPLDKIDIRKKGELQTFFIESITDSLDTNLLQKIRDLSKVNVFEHITKNSLEIFNLIEE